MENLEGQCSKALPNKEAMASICKIQKTYPRFLSGKETKDLKNELQLWSALANAPAQTIVY